MLVNWRGESDEVEEWAVWVFPLTISKGILELGMVYSFPLEGLLIVAEKRGARTVRKGSVCCTTFISRCL
jgi:hypothetical protein